MTIAVSAAVEGEVDEAILRHLVHSIGGSVAVVYGKRGKAYIDQSIQGFNQAARHGLWIVLRDLNGDAACAAELKDRLLPFPAPHMCLRIAVRAAEAWLLADRERMSQFLGVPAARIPLDPDSVADPKLEIVNIARHSRFRRVREELVPETGVTARVGPLYTARLIEFIGARWQPSAAVGNSDSLRRCIRAIRQVANTP